jgi:16S rRNA (cytidine1402-2'-O)-methyltransferase
VADPRQAIGGGDPRPDTGAARSPGPIVPVMPGTLTLCATPIGNLGDASPRLAETLAGSDRVFAEDTRRARVLLDHLGVDRPLASYFVGNEADRGAELAEHLRNGESVALISDAGMPGVADPGVSAVRVAREVGARVSVIPGPSAVIAAVAVSGFGADRFVFEGFLPRKGGERRRRVEQVALEERTVVLFSSPRRLTRDLEDLAAVCGDDRALCVARELSKRFEEIWWGSTGAAAAHWAGVGPRGEFTVVLAPADRPADLDGAVEIARELLEEGASRSDAARRAAAASGASRREIYERIGSISRSAGRDTPHTRPSP